MALPRTPRDRWIDAAIEALCNGGPASVRVEALASALGVTKGGFYGYFDGREALLDEVLHAWERRCTTEVLAQIAREGGDGPARLRRAGQLTSTDDFRRLDLAVRAWARHDAAVAKRLARIDGERMRFLREAFSSFIDDPDEVEARCTLTFTLAIGRHFIVAKHPKRSAREVVQHAAELLLRPMPKPRRQ